MRKDNTTLAIKLGLRRAALKCFTEENPPVVLEAYGGLGSIYKHLYREVPAGVVFEKDPEKAKVLSAQRQTWAVYQADCVNAVAAGFGSHLPCNLIDVDPYGTPWDFLTAFFTSERPFPPLLVLAVNDGLRMKLQIGGAWEIPILRPSVLKHGNELGAIYGEVCHEILTEIVRPRGYRVVSFRYQYAGASKRMTHYLARLERPPEETPPDPS